MCACGEGMGAEPAMCARMLLVRFLITVLARKRDERVPTWSWLELFRLSLGDSVTGVGASSSSGIWSHLRCNLLAGVKINGTAQERGHSPYTSGLCSTCL